MQGYKHFSRKQVTGHKDQPTPQMHPQREK